MVMMNHQHPRSSSKASLVQAVLFHVMSICSSNLACIYAGSASISASAAKAEHSKQTQSRYLQCAHRLCKSAASVMLHGSADFVLAARSVKHIVCSNFAQRFWPDSYSM